MHPLKSLSVHELQRLQEAARHELSVRMREDEGAVLEGLENPAKEPEISPDPCKLPILGRQSFCPHCKLLGGTSTLSMLSAVIVDGKEVHSYGCNAGHVW